MKYRIVKRRDSILNKDFYYVESRNYFWNSWSSAAPHMFTSLEAAQNEIETIKKIEYYYQ